MGLADGILPVTFALDSEDDLEEEQRLLYVAVTRARNSLFLTLHHEGTRGGITQFNKISRFIDIPNVLSMLDYSGISGAVSKTGTIDEFGDGAPLFDKKALLDKVMKFYRETG
jgi:ketol-acid reductoisomerase